MVKIAGPQPVQFPTVRLVVYKSVEEATGEKKDRVAVALCKVEEPAINKSPVLLMVVEADVPMLSSLPQSFTPKKLVEVALVVVELPKI